MKHLILIIAILINTYIANAQWIKIDSVPTNNALWNIKFPSRNIGYAVGAEGTIVKTTDGGDTWKLINNNISSLFEGLFCLDTNKIYLVGDKIYKSIDGGQSWTSKSIGTNNYLHSIFFVDSIVGYAVGGSGLILKTIDHGTSWQTLKISSTYDINSVYFTNRDTGFVAGHDGIFKTTNGGNTWILSKAAVDTWFRSIYFTDKNIGYVAGDKGVILKTINCGEDWVPVNNSLKYDLNSIIFSTSEIGYAFGIAGIILKTNNAGQRWTLYYGNGYSYLYSAAAFISADTGFVVGLEGTILKTINGGGPEYNYNPLKDFTSNVSYWTCDYAMVDLSFNVDTVFPGDTACWDFGDEGSYCISHTSGASHIYTKPGTYSISLTFTRNGNSKTITKQNIVTIRNKPTPSFEYSHKDTILFAPSTINFINKSMPGDGDTLTYRWSFGDGATSDSVNATHTYNNAGTYYIHLNVRDNLGCNFNASDELIIKDTLQRNEFSFITSNCLGYEEPTSGCEKHFSIENDTLKISGFYSGNCCTNKTATLRNSGDTIYIRTFETGPECDCDCGYCFSINVPNIYKDSIIVSFDGNVTVAKLQTSVSDLKNLCYLEVYPNPASNEFTILCNYLNIASSIEMTDLSGVRRYFEPNTLSDRMVINCNDFTQGVYILKVNTKNGGFLSKKIIIKSNH